MEKFAWTLKSSTYVYDGLHSWINLRLSSDRGLMEQLNGLGCLLGTD